MFSFVWMVKSRISFVGNVCVMSALISCIPLSGCSQKNAGEEIAKVGDARITKSQFEAFLQSKGIPLSDSQRYKSALEAYVKRDAIATAIEKTKTVDENEIAARLAEYRQQMLVSRYFEKFLKGRITPEAVRNFYNENIKQYEKSQVHVAHIMLRTNPKMTKAEREAVLTHMQEIYSEVTSGKEFAEVAKNVSEDKNSSLKGGDLGWIDMGAIDPVFSKRAFEMSAGEISKPFATHFGYHIVKVLESPRVTKNSLEQVKGQIEYRLRQQAKAAEMKRLQDMVKISISKIARKDS